MPAPRLIALDEEATGPRSAAEFAAFRAAHEALPHAALRRIADQRRAALILAHYHDADRRKKAADDLAEAKKNADQLRKNAKKAKTTEPDAAIAADRIAEHAARALADLDKTPPVPDLAPCPVDRCPGHAALSFAELRRAARLVRPITPGQKADAKKKRDAARAA